MSQDPPSLHYKDQVAPVPTERRRSLNRDPDGQLLAAEDGTLLAAKSHRVSTARQAEPVESPRNKDNVRAPPSSSSAAEATATLMAFDVVAVEGTTTGDPLAFAVVDDEERIVDDEESISVGTSVGTSIGTSIGTSNNDNNDNNNNNNNNNNNSVIVPNINKNDRNVTAAPSQINHVHAPKSFSWNTAIVAVAVVVIAIAAIAGVVVGVVCGSGGCGGTSADAAHATSPMEAGNGDNPSPPTTMAPTTLSPVEAYNGNNTTSPTTMAPTTLSPVEAGNGNNPSPPTTTMAPTTPSSPTTSSRSQDITNFINSKSYIGVDLLPTGTSPEERALQWLIYDDPLQLNAGAEVDEFRLLQRYSLLTLWFQAGTGTAWRNSTNWLTANECTWFGITCQSGVATEVDFYQDELEVANGLGGTLSPDLGLLTALEYSDVYHNSLTGPLPSEIGLCTNLREIYVANNFLTGSLPLEIGFWTNLEWFDVSSNALTGTIPATVANWKLIESAHFYDNNFSGSMPDGICEFITGTDTLLADCELKLTCSCCTNCF